MVQEDQDNEDEAAEVNQVHPVMPAPQQPQSTPITPPVLQGHVPAELLPPTQIPSFVMTPLPPVQPSTTTAPPPPPPGPPPSEESPQQISQPIAQQPAQPEPSVPSQQSLPSTKNRCPEILGPASPMTQEACNQEVHLKYHHHYLNILLEMEVLGLTQDRCIAVHLMLH